MAGQGKFIEVAIVSKRASAAHDGSHGDEEARLVVFRHVRDVIRGQVLSPVDETNYARLINIGDWSHRCHRYTRQALPRLGR